jgi:hypothetical protein
MTLRARNANALAMSEEVKTDNQRIPWTARINVKPTAREQVIAIARMERLAIASVIGAAIDHYLTARSSSC